MIQTYLYGIISVSIVSLLSLVGVFTLSLNKDSLKKYVFLLVSLALGALLGDTFIHIIPEMFSEGEHSSVISLYIILGILLFFILEKFLHWHHHDSDCEGKHQVGTMVLISDGIHNVIDGIMIGTSYFVSIPFGIATTIAIALHEIPQELGNFGVLIHSGFSFKRAIWLNFVSALTSFVGLFIAFVLNDFYTSLIYILMPITAGGFIYIAMSDLMPELQKNKHYTVLQIVFVLLGVSSMFLLTFLE